jgi:hypothetical protein
MLNIENTLLNIFTTKPFSTGSVVTIEEFTRDINKELQWYSSPPYFIFTSNASLKALPRKLKDITKSIMHTPGMIARYAASKTM